MTQLNDALFNFGFKTQEAQEAFLENLYFAGYFEPSTMLQALEWMQYDKDGNLTAKWPNLRLTYLYLKRAINRAKAGQKNALQFRPAKLLHNFLADDIFDYQDVEDIIFYVAQNAFGRLPNQERNELPHFPWMDLHKQKYIQNARKLNLIEEINPKLKKYDECWIQGAARLRIITRMKYLKNLIDNGVDVGKIRLLTGARELWAEMAIVTDLEESKQNMLALAKENGIAVESASPFVVRQVGNANRTYLNYAKGEDRVITETMMAKKNYRLIFGNEIDEVVDSKAALGLMRPNTEQNAKDVALLLKERIEKGDFSHHINILVVSNQPYCERQTITILRAVKKIITQQNINFEGVGEASAVGVGAIHSELGALVTEMYMRKIESDNKPRKRKAEQLMFSTRFFDAK